MGRLVMWGFRGLRWGPQLQASLGLGASGLGSFRLWGNTQLGLACQPHNPYMQHPKLRKDLGLTALEFKVGGRWSFKVRVHIASLEGAEVKVNR